MISPGQSHSLCHKDSDLAQDGNNKIGFVSEKDLARTRESYILISVMKNKTFYVSILDTKTNTLTRVKGDVNYGYPDGETIDICFEHKDLIVIGVTDDREVFCEDEDGKFSVI